MNHTGRLGLPSIHSARAAVVVLLATSYSVMAQTNVLTHHNDLSRTGQNLTETILTPANVSSGGFGKLFSLTVDGQVYAQPLYMSSLTIGGRARRVVFVATEHDSVYAFDADTGGAPLWQASLFDAAHGAPAGSMPDPIDDTGCYNSVGPEIGITGTPVIDPATGTMYVVARTFENGYPVQRLHALDIKTGAEKLGGPMTLQASVPGTGSGSSNGVMTYDPKWANQRAGLLLLNGTVYMAHGSFCDAGAWHGWILAHDATTLAQTSVFLTTPNGANSGIWMGGSGLAAETINGVPRMFIATGNGTFDAAPPYGTNTMDYGDDVVRLDLAGGMKVADSFTPSNQASLQANDRDLGSGGIVLLPDQPGPHTRLLAQIGKSGALFLIDRDNMGGYSTAANNVAQELQVSPVWGKAAYWNGNLYMWPGEDRLLQFTVSNGTVTAGPMGPLQSSSFGAIPTISSNGTTNGIVWSIAWSQPTQVLFASDATNVSNTLWTSTLNSARDTAGGQVKFSVPTIADGKVFVGSVGTVSVYGMFPDYAVNASPGSVSMAQGGNTSTAILISALYGFTGTVSLSASSLPSGVTASFDTSTVNGSGSSLLTLTASASAATGTFTIPVTATSGSLAHVTQVTLTVTAGGPPAFPNGYAHRRFVVINHNSVPNTDQSNFPFWFSTVDPLFKTVANGGHVNNTNGYDIVFSTDPNGAGANLKHEIGQYNASTGKFTAWVNVPLVSRTTDTVLYAFYGNAGVTSSQESKAGVWNSNYAGVWHLTNATDSTANSNSGSAGSGVSSAGGGMVGIGQSFNGSANAYIDMGTSPTLDMAGAFTFSAWFKKTSYTGSYEVLASKCSLSACNYEMALDGPRHDLEGVQNGVIVETGFVPSLNQWHYAVEVSDTTHLYFYVDGVLVKTSNAGTGAVLAGTHFDLGREHLGGENFSGILDEARLSKSVRSSDWISAEYRNQSNPTSFFTIGIEDSTTPPGGGPTGYPNGYAKRRTVTINHLNVSNADQSGFPVLFSIADPLFKTVANGGRVNSASGFDIVFSTDPNGAGAILKHEIGQYSATTGTFKAWVNVPVLSHTTDTVLYVFYGNPSVTTSQENKAAVWDANFVGIYHLPVTSGVTGSGVTSAGGAMVGVGASFDGSANAYIDLGTSTAFDLPGAFTFSTWFKKTSYTGNWEILASKCSAAACNYELALDGPNHDFEGVQNGTVFESGVVPSLNQWHYVVEVSDGSRLYFYMDGALLKTVTAGTGSTLPGTHFNLGREQIAGESFKGILDEARLSKSIRTADWIATEYRNQTNPAAFYSISAEQ